METSALNIFSLVIGSQLVVLVLFLFTSSKGKKLSNRLLAFFFLWLAFNLVDGILLFYGFYEKFPALAHLEDGGILLVGPLLYFYTLSMVYHDFSFKKSHIFHVLPFVIFTIGYQTYYHTQSHEYQKLIQKAIAAQKLPAIFYVSAAIVYLQIITYFVFSFKEVGQYRIKIRERFSSVSKINLDWLTFMLGFIVFVFVVSVTYTFLPATGFRRFFDDSVWVPFVILFFFINAVVWKGLKQPEIFSGLEYTTEKEEKYAGSGLSEAEKNQILQQLRAVVSEEKPYLQSDITIDQLAEKTNTTIKKLSQTINSSFHQNFFDFINSQRIEEAKRIMKESKDTKLTVLEVMYGSGFNSKSSFNTIFRKKTGVTPKEFRQAVLAGPSSAT